ncbi:MAG: putative baseplate assembly protein [Acidobacteriota bacterium]
MQSAPKIDSRTTNTLMDQLQNLLALYVPNWSRDKQGIGAALVGISARFAEIIIERLNQVPEKNFLAYLNMLGISRLPPQAARVPLTFSLAGESSADTIVPARTQVATMPLEGESAPIVFETERELLVTLVSLTSLFLRNPQTDMYTDHSSIANNLRNPGVSIFTAEENIEHIFYLGHDTIFSHPGFNNLSIYLNIKKIPNVDIIKTESRWEIWNSTNNLWTAITPAKDETVQLTRSGEILFNNLVPLSQQCVNGLYNHWIRCRLLTPITQVTEKQTDQKRATVLPTLDSIKMSATLSRNNLAIENAFTNEFELDLSKDFYPFGEKPKFGDTFYLALNEAFSQTGANVTLQINLSKLAGTGITEAPKDQQAKPAGAKDPQAKPPIPTAQDLQLKWEFWNGQKWLELGFTSKTGTITAYALPFDSNFRDETNAFTKTGRIYFTFPQKPFPVLINGVETCWIRVRIIAGDYGKEAEYTYNNTTQKGSYQNATYNPPIIQSVSVEYNVNRSEPPTHIFTYNNLNFEDTTKGEFKPFQATNETVPTLYFGFALPPYKSFPNRKLSIYVGLDDFKYGEVVSLTPQRQGQGSPKLDWEYWNGNGWVKISLHDESENFTRSGIIEFLAPSDLTIRREFGLDRYWLRVAWRDGEYLFMPRVHSLFLNTVMAQQSVTINNETLGNSNGSPNQKLFTARKPILAGQQLQVRESKLPAFPEQEKIKAEEGEDAISITSDTTGRPVEIWIGWKEVSDFYASGPRDRHYVINQLTGEICFGNGLNGLIPETGNSNIRMKYYQTTNGSNGNRQKGNISQLKTTIPYIAKVTNYEVASGGADAESLESLYYRGPRLLRHRSRAVTAEDYEDLTLMASPAVARVKCMPLYDLKSDPKADKEIPGFISLIIVPQSVDLKPVPGMELLNRIYNYLVDKQSPTASLVVVGPTYFQVDIAVEVVLNSMESANTVEYSINDALTRFLHPITGGNDGYGWEFGRKPHHSDIYRLLFPIEGVNYIRKLAITFKNELGIIVPVDTEAEPAKNDYSLIYSGTHTISMIFE